MAILPQLASAGWAHLQITTLTTYNLPTADCLSCGPSTGGTISSVCSCVVCTQEYAPAPAPAPLPGQDTEPGPEVRLEHSNSSLEHSNSGNSSMVEHNCGNNKCIMCGPAPPQRTQEADTATVRVAVVSPSLHNNNNNNSISSSSSVVEQSSVGSRPQVAPPPPLPKKTVAPYQVPGHTGHAPVSPLESRNNLRNTPPANGGDVLPCKYKMLPHRVRIVKLLKFRNTSLGWRIRCQVWRTRARRRGEIKEGRSRQQKGWSS